MQVSETTGEAEYVKIDNLCNNYENDSLEHAVKQFVLLKFARSNKCSIRKVWMEKFCNSSIED